MRRRKDLFKKRRERKRESGKGRRISDHIIPLIISSMIIIT